MKPGRPQVMHDPATAGRAAMFWPAAAVSAWTGTLFMAVYHLCNWITAGRNDARVAFFDWEHAIPVIPWFIVPYWLLDLFFVIAPFLCTSRGELQTLRRRLEVATLAAGLCFLAIPLTLAWERPEVQGVFSPWFQAIQGFDAPHNLFPSLHIAYRTILAAHYARHSAGSVRVVSHIWFSLVGFSTLFTRQHHFVDVAGGFLLAGVCFRLGTADSQPRPDRNMRVGSLYLLAALLCLLLANVALPWSLALSWPAASLGLAAAASLGGGAAVIGKTGGRISWLSKALFAPWLFGQWLSWLHYRRRSSPWDEVHPGLWIGALPDDSAARKAKAAGMTHVLDLTAEFDASEEFRALPGYLNLPVQDLTAPMAHHVEAGISHVDEALRSGGKVLVHCKAGYSRSAAIAGAWLLRRGIARDADEAVRVLKEKRPGMVVRPEIWRLLREMAAAKSA